MKYFFYIFLYMLIALLLVQNYLLAAALGALFFTYRVSALPLIPLAFCVDGFFGAFYHIPMFSIVAVVWYLVSELLRPLIAIKPSIYGNAS